MCFKEKTKIPWIITVAEANSAPQSHSPAASPDNHTTFSSGESDTDSSKKSDVLQAWAKE